MSDHQSLAGEVLGPPKNNHILFLFLKKIRLYTLKNSLKLKDVRVEE